MCVCVSVCVCRVLQLLIISIQPRFLGLQFVGLQNNASFSSSYSNFANLGCLSEQLVHAQQTCPWSATNYSTQQLALHQNGSCKAALNWPFHAAINFIDIELFASTIMHAWSIISHFVHICILVFMFESGAFICVVFLARSLEISRGPNLEAINYSRIKIL